MKRLILAPLLLFGCSSDELVYYCHSDGRILSFPNSSELVDAVGNEQGWRDCSEVENYVVAWEDSGASVTTGAAITGCTNKDIIYVFPKYLGINGQSGVSMYRAGDNGMCELLYESDDPLLSE